MFYEKVVLKRFKALEKKLFLYKKVFAGDLFRKVADLCQQCYEKAVLFSELCETLQNICTIENQEMVVSDPTRLFRPRYYYD